MIGHSLKNIFDSLGFAYDFAFCQNKWSSKNLQNVSFSIPHLRKIIFKIYIQKTQEFKNEIEHKQTKTAGT